MKKRLLMLLSFFMAITSMGWVHAEGTTTGSITSEITVAQKEKPIVFGITTKKGNVADNTMVRVSLTADGNAFNNWESYYYEPNGENPSWVKWDPKNDAFGPKDGFPFQDATSYIQVIPKTPGTFYYTLNVTKVSEQQPFITKKCTLIVENNPVFPIASIGGTDYASLATAVHFAKEDTTIKLTAGNFSLASQLVINKPLTLLGAADENGKPLTNLQADAHAVWPTKPNSQDLENSKTNLVSIEGTAGGNVFLKNISVMNSKASGINTQSKMTTNLVNVVLEGNANAGLLVHSTVVADKLITIKNGWGGVNVDKGTPEYSPTFKFDSTSSFAEDSKIWSEDTTTDPNQLVEGPNGWTSYVGVQGASSKEMRYWMNSKLTVETVTDFYTDKTFTGGFTLIYANGNPITVETSGTDKVKISAGSDDVLEVATAKNPIIFGGAKFGDVESSSITMESGQVYMLVGGGYLGNVKNANVTVNGGNVTKYLVGGGYGPKQAFSATNGQTADVTNATVKINKGAIVRYLISGGLMYAKTTTTDVQITGAAIEYALGGGYAPVGIKQSEQTDFATNVNTIGTAKFSMTGGTVKGAICLGGGYSYSYTKNITATIDGVAITGGLYGIGWNGRSDKVNATITKSSFTKSGSGNSTIASLVRGKADEISMVFDNCTFNSGYECYLSADQNWQDGSYPTPVSGKTTITFVGENTPEVKVSEGMQDVTVIGAEVNVDKFLQKKENTFINKFEVPSGKTWSFLKGMTIAEGVTLTNNGTLNVKGIDNVADLQSAVTTGANSIGLTAKTFELPGHLLINKPMVIEGMITDKDSTIIKPESGWSGSDGTNKNLIRIDASNTTLKNLLVEGSKTGSGIHVYNTKDVTLDNVISRNNTAAGLIVNGSTVTATNFRTSGNGWYGVNVDKGTGVESEPVFTIGTGCSFGEDNAIYADLKNATTDDASKYVVSNEWIMTKVSGKDHEYRWINAAAGGIDYAIISVPSTVVYGSANLPLISNVGDTKKVSFSVPENEFVSIKTKGGKAKYDSLEIKKPGSVAIKMTIGDTIVSQQLEVLKRVITVSGIKAEKKTYDGNTDVDLNTQGVKVEGFLGEDSAFSNYCGTLSSANAGDAVPVEIKATFTDAAYANYYDVSYVAVTDTVTKADLIVSTKKINSSINFGAEIPEFEANVIGLQNGEQEKDVLGGELKFDCPATSTSLAGKYPVKPYGYTSDNYNIIYEADSLEIKAIAPTVELVSATVSADKSKVTAKGRIISNGGTPTTKLKGGFMVNSSDKATGLDVKQDGTFSAELSEFGNQEIEIKATAAIQELKGISTGTSVDLSKQLQNVNFVSELSRLTYGSTAQLSAKDFAEGANVTFAFESADASIEKVDSTTIKAIKVGRATITVTAEKEGYITAIAKQTVTVEPKNLTVTAGVVSKSYDGKLSADLPEFTLNGIVNGDNVTVNTNNVTASFVDKNVGENKPVVLSGNLTLAGTNASNYILTQPTGLKGSIKQGSAVKVIVSDVKRKYNETTLKYNLKFMAGETDLTSSPYTGAVNVTEKDGKFEVVINNVSFPNYGKVEADPKTGDIEIEKGTPKVLTYNINDMTVGAELLDAEGWDIQHITIEEESAKFYAQVSYDKGTQTARGAALAKQSAPSISWDFSASKALRSTLVTKADSKTMKFGESMTLKKENGYTYAVANTKVLTLITNNDENYIVNAVGVGTGAITATNAQGAVAYISIKVDPKELTVSATGTDKTFDNTTSANVSLAIEDMPEGVSLDLDGVTFNYANTNVGSGISIIPSKPITLSGANAANYRLNTQSFTGNITARELTITSPISKYYDGSVTMTLSDYSAEGLLEGEAVPAVIATFEDNNVGVNKIVKLTTTDTNYQLVGHSDLKGNIVKSTLDATLPSGASSVDNLKKNVTLVVRETGASVTPEAVSYNPTISTEGSSSNTVYYISGGDNDNYSVVYDKNQIGYKANVTPPDGGGDGDGEQTLTISLNASSKVLPRTEEFELTATVSPAGQTVTWSSSDPTIATVTANGNKATVKGFKVGKATITAKIGDVTATCLVTVDFATGIEEMLAQTEVYSRQGNIIVNPVQPLQLTIVNMTGQTVYNDYISGSTQIPARSGVYIVKLSNAGNTIISKLIVR